MRRILLIGNSDVGLYKFRKELIEKLLEEKYEVTISTPYGAFVSELEKMGCKYENIEYNRAGKNPLRELWLLVKYGRLIKRNSYDVVLLYTIKPTLYAGMICRMRRIPYLVNITGLSPILTEKEIMRKLCFFIYRRVLPYANIVFFQNKENLHLFQRYNAAGDHVKLIPGSGVNLKENCYEEYEEDNFLKILYIGRITRIKGIEDLLEAINMLGNELSDIKVEFIGECDPDYAPKFERLSLEKRIVYHGFCSNPHEYLKKCQAVIMPSYGEGMSNVLLEASACGRPVLASNVQGCKEIVKDGITGFLFCPHNAKDIVECFRKFQRLTREQRKQMGIMGRKHIEEHFSRDIVIKEYMNRINDICGGEKNEYL